MPDNPSNEVVAGDGVGNTAPSAQPDSSPSIDAETIFNSLKDYPGFQQFVKSQAQSKHDKRIGRIEKQLGLSETMAEVDRIQSETGMPREFAIQWYEMQRQQAQAVTPEVDPTVVPDASAGQAQVAGQDNPVLQQAVDLGLDPNGPEVINVLREGGSQVEQIRKLTASWKAGQAAPVAPNPAATMPTSTGSPPAQPPLQAQYEAERDAIGLGKPMEIQALKEKFRAQGLNIL